MYALVYKTCLSLVHAIHVLYQYKYIHDKGAVHGVSRNCCPNQFHNQNK